MSHKSQLKKHYRPHMPFKCQKCKYVGSRSLWRWLFAERWSCCKWCIELCAVHLTHGQLTEFTPPPKKEGN